MSDTTVDDSVHGRDCPLHSPAAADRVVARVEGATASRLGRPLVAQKKTPPANGRRRVGVVENELRPDQNVMLQLLM
jgi:hypothetical protein